MTYYQYTTTRAGQSSPFSNKCCAVKAANLIHGELFVSFVKGEPEAFKALKCPTCGAVFTEHFWTTNDGTIENAHFLEDTKED